MIEAIQAWWAARQQRIKRAKFNDGYDWAAGALLRGDRSPEGLEAYVEIQVFHEKDLGLAEHRFDLGAMQAVRDWRAK